MGHLGLTPQSVHRFGGFRVQGKTLDAAREIVDDAVALAEAGCFAIVLECVPDAVARMVTDSVPVPTIGIGAGRHCDGQVLVYHDILGFEDRVRPKFVRRYADLQSEATRGDRTLRRRRTRRSLPRERRDVPRRRRGHRGTRAVRLGRARARLTSSAMSSRRAVTITFLAVVVDRARRGCREGPGRGGGPRPARGRPPAVGDPEPRHARRRAVRAASGISTSRSATTAASASRSPTRWTSAPPGCATTPNSARTTACSSCSPAPPRRGFTMSGVTAPLDIAFFDSDGARNSTRAMKPCLEKADGRVPGLPGRRPLRLRGRDAQGPAPRRPRHRLQPCLIARSLRAGIPGSRRSLAGEHPPLAPLVSGPPHARILSHPRRKVALDRSDRRPTASLTRSAVFLRPPLRTCSGSGGRPWTCATVRRRSGP